MLSHHAETGRAVNFFLFFGGGGGGGGLGKGGSQCLLSWNIALQAKSTHFFQASLSLSLSISLSHTPTPSRIWLTLKF